MCVCVRVHVFVLQLPGYSYFRHPKKKKKRVLETKGTRRHFAPRRQRLIISLNYAYTLIFFSFFFLGGGGLQGSTSLCDEPYILYIETVDSARVSVLVRLPSRCVALIEQT